LLYELALVGEDMVVELGEKITAKLDNHFIPDCVCSKLEKMWQKEGESVAQYHVHLRLQVAKCGFTDPDDAI